MKILFLGEPDSPNTISWVNGLREQGADVVMASARANENTHDCIPIGRPTLPPRIRILTGVQSLKKIISEVRPDILLAYRVTSYGYIAAKSGFHPLVIAAQNEQIVYLPTPSYLRRKFLERCAKFAVLHADLLHAWSSNIADGLKKFGADEQMILTLHRGIDTEIFQPDSAKTFNPDAPAFISTRSLYPEYRIETVISAFSELLNKIPGAHLHIAGSGPEEENLKQLAARAGAADKVTFHGRLPHEKTAALLRKSDIYISVIETEGLSSSLIEAAACGIMPIVTDMPASRELIKDKKNGLLTAAISTEKLADLMKEAAKSIVYMHKDLYANAERIRTKFDRKTNQNVFIEKYRNLLQD